VQYPTNLGPSENLVFTNLGCSESLV